MAFPSAWRRRRRPSLSKERAFAALHGRALYLPRPALRQSLYPAGHSLPDALRPFQRRLYRQRAAITALRALALAAAVAVVVVLLRLGGLALPVPAAPLAAAAATLLAALATMPWQRPSLGQVAHTLDRRLGLHEQIGSALELDEDNGRLAAALRRRVGAALSDTRPDYILPWPSLRRERAALVAAAVCVGVGALLAQHAPSIRPEATAPGGQALGARHERMAARRHAPTPGVAPLRIVALSVPNAGRSTTPAHVEGAANRVGAGGQGQPQRRGLTQNTSRSANGAARFLTGKASAPNAARAGQATTSAPAPRGGQGGSATGNGRGSGAQANKGGGLRLTSGQNSSANGVMSPQQQQAQAAQAAQAQGQGAASSQQGRQNQQGQQGRNAGTTSANTSAPANSGSGKQGRSAAGSKQAADRGRAGTHGQGRAGTGTTSAGGNKGGGSRSAAGATSSQGGAAGQARGNMTGDGNLGLSRRIGSGGLGQPASGSTGYPGAPGKTSSRASLSGSGFTLGNAPGSSGVKEGAFVGLGAPTGAPGLGGASLAAGPSATNSLDVVPGYVAPDSNAVPPDDRAVVRGYFSPTNSGQ